jgi:hypothetical protein
VDKEVLNGLQLANGLNIMVMAHAHSSTFQFLMNMCICCILVTCPKHIRWLEGSRSLHPTLPPKELYSDTYAIVLV